MKPFTTKGTRKTVAIIVPKKIPKNAIGEILRDMIVVLCVFIYYSDRSNVEFLPSSKKFLPLIYR